MRTLPATFWLRGPLALLALASVVMVLRAPDERTPWWGLTGNLLDVNVYRWGGRAARANSPIWPAICCRRCRAISPVRRFPSMVVSAARRLAS